MSGAESVVLKVVLGLVVSPRKPSAILVEFSGSF
jgi:hypothetical protein